MCCTGQVLRPPKYIPGTRGDAAIHPEVPDVLEESPLEVSCLLIFKYKSDLNIIQASLNILYGKVRQ